MRASSLVVLLALFVITTVAASAQPQPLRNNRPTQPQLQRIELQAERPTQQRRTNDLNRLERARPGEVRLVTLERPSQRRRGRLADRYLGVHANRSQRIRTRSVAPATPVLRKIRTQEGTYVRRHGSYFRVVSTD